MELLETTPRAWGNSLGITFPREIVQKEHLSTERKVRVLVIGVEHTPRRIFGMMKGKWNKTGRQIKDQARAELHHD